MITQNITGKLVTVKRLNNSINGNPNYKLELVTDNDVIIEVTTLNDLMVNYTLGYHLENKDVALKVKVNRKSNKLLDIVA